MPELIWNRKLVSKVGEEILTQEYDAFDRFGRRIGARAVLSTSVLAEMTPEEIEEKKQRGYGGIAAPAGTWYSFTPSATRNGRSYGASQSPRSFASPAERQAAINQYFADAQKRAMKKAKVTA